MDTQALVEALSREEHAYLLDLTIHDITRDKHEVLTQLMLPAQDLRDLHEKLKQYRLVRSLDALRFGGYVRWINLANPERIHLTNGGIVCDMKADKHNNGHVVVKNNMHRLFQLNMSNVLLFQKLTQQERIILHAMTVLAAQDS
jgi:hypothetical protein